MYALPKVHKPNAPLPPVLAAHKTSSYRLAQFLEPLLQNYFIIELQVQNSFEFQKSTFTMNLPSAPYLTSFNEQSLFTNISLDETIDLICNIIFENLTTFYNMSAAELMRTFSLVCKEVILFLTTYFINR